MGPLPRENHLLLLFVSLAGSQPHRCQVDLEVQFCAIWVGGSSAPLHLGGFSTWWCFLKSDGVVEPCVKDAQGHCLPKSGRRGSLKKLHDICSPLPVVGCTCTLLSDSCKHQGHMAVTRGHRYWLLAITAVRWRLSSIEIANSLWVRQILLPWELRLTG